MYRVIHYLIIGHWFNFKETSFVWINILKPLIEIPLNNILDMLHIRKCKNSILTRWIHCRVIGFMAMNHFWIYVSKERTLYIYRERQDSMFERKRKLCSEKNSLKTFTTIKINLSSRKVKGKKNKKTLRHYLLKILSCHLLEPNLLKKRIYKY